MKHKIGTAVGDFRMDGGVAWKGMPRENYVREQRVMSKAKKSRIKMIEDQEKLHRGQTLTGIVVKEIIGGEFAAVQQVREYEELFEQIKQGKTAGSEKNVATEARQRMIERDKERYPDIGKDKANRRAYPKNG